MGLFDKLKNTVNIVKDSVLSVEDPTVKRYYDVILVLLSHVEYLSKENIKRYSQGQALFVCGNRRMQINVMVSENELESFGSGGGL